MEATDPLRLSLAAPAGETGLSLARRLREQAMECEYADEEHLVLMLTPDNTLEELTRLEQALGFAPAPPKAKSPLPQARGQQAMSVQQALFAPQETIPANQSLGRVCGAPTVSCPPAVPIAVSGERIGPEALTLFTHYGVEWVDVVKE